MEYLGIIEFENGDYYEVCIVSSEGKKYIEAGSCTNTMFLTDYGIDYDDDASLDDNLQRLYDHIIECKQQDADIRHLLELY